MAHRSSAGLTATQGPGTAAQAEGRGSVGRRGAAVCQRCTEVGTRGTDLGSFLGNLGAGRGLDPESTVAESCFCRRKLSVFSEQILGGPER